jgi:ABC-type transporter Mla subunit MlaD
MNQPATSVMTAQYLSREELLDTTVRGLQTDLTQLVPAFDGLVMQWSHLFTGSGSDFDQIGIKLSELKEALTAGHAPQIAEMLHGLSKLTRDAAGDDAALNRLAEALSDAAGRVAQV